MDGVVVHHFAAFLGVTQLPEVTRGSDSRNRSPKTLRSGVNVSVAGGKNTQLGQVAANPATPTPIAE